MASTELDLSLDEIIKQRKQSSRGGARGGRGTRGNPYGGRGAGPLRRNTRGAYRPAPYGAAKPTPMATDGAWQHDLFGSGAAAPIAPAAGGIETGTKLYISNLDFGVSNEDVKELFSEIGDLKRSAVHYDRSGRSKGTAEVVFARKADALAAMQRYNNVQLDGKPMKIEIIGTNVAQVSAAARLGPGPVATVAMKQRGAARPRGAYVNRGGRGDFRGRGRGRRNQQPTKSKEELDAELDSYHETKAEDMQS